MRRRTDAAGPAMGGGRFLRGWLDEPVDRLDCGLERGEVIAVDPRGSRAEDGPGAAAAP